MIKLEIRDQDVINALNEVARRTGNLSPILRVIGEDMLSRIKQRFDTSTGPDGQRWAANSEATMLAFIGAKGGIGKRGKVTKRGATIGASKRPLIGHSGDLARENHYNVSGNTLTVGNTMIYAGTQQFGAKKGQYGRDRHGRPVPWGNIPARPFMPVHADGTLYPDEQKLILSAVSDYLSKAAG